MPRRFSDELNSLKLWDNISNSEIELYYRTPTTEERLAYQNECILRKRSKILFRTPQARQKWGLKILEGFREGDFEVKKGNNYVQISSDTKSSNYNANWKDLFAKHAMDLVELLAAHVFDVSAETLDEEAEGDEISGPEEGSAEKNS